MAKVARLMTIDDLPPGFVARDGVAVYARERIEVSFRRDNGVEVSFLGDDEDGDDDWCIRFSRQAPVAAIVAVVQSVPS